MCPAWLEQIKRAAEHVRALEGPRVKWSLAAVSSTALPPDWFSWRHPPSCSSFLKSSLLSLNWTAILQTTDTHTRTHTFSQHLICFAESSNSPMDSWQIRLRRWSKIFPVYIQHKWHLPVMECLSNRGGWWHHLGLFWNGYPLRCALLKTIPGCRWGPSVAQSGVLREGKRGSAASRRSTLADERCLQEAPSSHQQRRVA